jgi:hypothetical protein
MVDEEVAAQEVAARSTKKSPQKTCGKGHCGAT